jgi:predicted transcriptional regulator
MSAPVATTLKIAADLKRRVIAAAKAADKSPHAFMLEAIEHQTRLDEQRRAFVAEAKAARSEDGPGLEHLAERRCRSTGCDATAPE